MTDFQTVLDALSVDPLLEAEKITGQSYKVDQMTSDLGFVMHLDNVQSKRELLKSVGDTYYSITWKDFLEIACSLGFVTVFQKNFSGKSYSGEEAPKETFVIMWNDSLGILVVAETYMHDRLNSAKMYYNVVPNKADNLEVFRTRTSSGCFYDGVWAGDHDISEGFVAKLNGLMAVGSFLTTWTKKPFLWFLTYMDTKDPDYDYKAINDERIALLPETMQNAIRGNSAE